MVLSQVALALILLIIVSGCQEKADKPPLPIRRDRYTERSIEIDSSIYSGPEPKEDAERDRDALQAGIHGKPVVVTLREVSYDYSENSASSISFAYDSGSFSYIRVTEKSGRSVYFSGLGMNRNVNLEATRYRITITRVDSISWFAAGKIEMDHKAMNGERTEIVRFDGLFMQPHL